MVITVSRRAVRIVRIIATLLTGFLLFVSLVWGYAEESGLHFVDPATGTEYQTEVSSIHFDLVYALSLCAGFSEADARMIQVFSELPDIQYVGPYSLGVGSLPPIPPSTEVCSSPVRLNVVFPVSDAIECPGCFTSRFGPFSPFFHYPRDNARELGQIRAWAYGQKQTLEADASFAYGGTQVVDARCIYTQTMTVDAGSIRPGSLEAFSIYLHSLGDSWSHKDCMKALDAAGEPWGTHTPQYEACNFTAHAREFGEPSTDTNRTVEGVHALYEALRTRSWMREGKFVPIDEHANAGWLNQQMYDFVHNWTAANPQARRDLAKQIANQCQSIRTGDPFYGARPRVGFLPLLLRNLGGSGSRSINQGGILSAERCNEPRWDGSLTAVPSDFSDRFLMVIVVVVIVTVGEGFHECDDGLLFFVTQHQVAHLVAIDVQLDKAERFWYN